MLGLELLQGFAQVITRQLLEHMFPEFLGLCACSLCGLVTNVMLCVLCVFEEGFIISKNGSPGLPKLVSGLLKMGFVSFGSVSVFS